MYSPLDPNIDFGFHFYERLWRGIVAEADRIDYSLLHFPASVRKGASTDAFLDGRIDGILYHANTHTDPNERPARLASAGLPTVLLTRSRDLPDGCGTVYIDENSTANLAMEHLWDLGHRRIAHIAGRMIEEDATGGGGRGPISHSDAWNGIECFCRNAVLTIPHSLASMAVGAIYVFPN